MSQFRKRMEALQMEERARWEQALIDSRLPKLYQRLVRDLALMEPCQCPDEHCGDCGCCTCLACGHTPEHHDPDDGCGACAMAMRPFRHEYQATT